MQCLPSAMLGQPNLEITRPIIRAQQAFNKKPLPPILWDKRQLRNGQGTNTHMSFMMWRSMW